MFPFFFFNDTATTEIYTLSLHDALPILQFLSETIVNGNPLVKNRPKSTRREPAPVPEFNPKETPPPGTRQKFLELGPRSEEHTSELQSPCNIVCRLLLDKKKNRLLRQQ